MRSRVLLRDSCCASKIRKTPSPQGLIQPKLAASKSIERRRSSLNQVIRGFRIERGLIVKLKRIVRSEFVHMDCSEAIAVLERATVKFEFPVQWGIDLQSEHERYLTEKYAKKPVIVMNYLTRPSRNQTG